MTRFVLVLPGVTAIALLVGVACGGVRDAQAADKVSDQVRLVAQSPEEIEPSPFDFVRQAAETSNKSSFSQKQVGQIGEPAVFASQKLLNSGEPTLQYNKKFIAKPGEAQKLYKTLVQKYGPPKSVRGTSHVWDIENPSTSHKQSDTVAVILSIEESGAFELIMDRDRGEDGRATWALPRRQMDSRVPSKTSRNSPKPANVRPLLVNPG